MVSLTMQRKRSFLKECIFPGGSCVGGMGAVISFREEEVPAISSLESFCNSWCAVTLLRGACGARMRTLCSKIVV